VGRNELAVLKHSTALIMYISMPTDEFSLVEAHLNHAAALHAGLPYVESQLQPKNPNQTRKPHRARDNYLP
jgi:hypothetical protein